MLALIGQKSIIYRTSKPTEKLKTKIYYDSTYTR